ncbi:hypothetical protein CAOG_06572 [Capsaspora owczarzaki ATCC 30864]|uniref:PH domain-containing protein n=1 Tax=Capsaspora owczarzaki (strain ATCC 30864) TaxID=595528 RepID=A0A0D2VX75_CAPO3|nr:hypothetical protein CAOG_06572 [Capsaspora owczarzaki ATCC 30864]KJE96217.1 hypothetical protein CAOG_006572 [Capsaspora owczarzaki ATCC 30864]|eukprot:XP_004345321.1 hypothetical protein CAOG_06572 [Capsaspora owczarzaki ATCC 30864]
MATAVSDTDWIEVDTADVFTTRYLDEETAGDDGADDDSRSNSFTSPAAAEPSTNATTANATQASQSTAHSNAVAAITLTAAARPSSQTAALPPTSHHATAVALPSSGSSTMSSSLATSPSSASDPSNAGSAEVSASTALVTAAAILGGFSGLHAALHPTFSSVITTSTAAKATGPTSIVHHGNPGPAASPSHHSASSLRSSPISSQSSSNTSLHTISAHGSSGNIQATVAAAASTPKHPDPPRTVREGQLRKLGYIWRNRWFVLTESTLFYFSYGNRNPTDLIHLDQVTSVSLKLEEIYTHCLIELIAKPATKWVLCGVDAEETESWLSAIKLCVAAASKRAKRRASRHARQSTVLSGSVPALAASTPGQPSSAGTLSLAVPGTAAAMTNRSIGGVAGTTPSNSIVIKAGAQSARNHRGVRPNDTDDSPPTSNSNSTGTSVVNSSAVFAGRGTGSAPTSNAATAMAIPSYALRRYNEVGPIPGMAGTSPAHFDPAFCTTSSTVVSPSNHAGGAQRGGFPPGIMLDASEAGQFMFSTNSNPLSPTSPPMSPPQHAVGSYMPPPNPGSTPVAGPHPGLLSASMVASKLKPFPSTPVFIMGGDDRSETSSVASRSRVNTDFSVAGDAEHHDDQQQQHQQASNRAALLRSESVLSEESTYSRPPPPLPPKTQNFAAQFADVDLNSGSTSPQPYQESSRHGDDDDTYSVNCFEDDTGTMRYEYRGTFTPVDRTRSDTTATSATRASTDADSLPRAPEGDRDLEIDDLIEYEIVPPQLGVVASPTTFLDTLNVSILRDTIACNPDSPLSHISRYLTNVANKAVHIGQLLANRPPFEKVNAPPPPPPLVTERGLLDALRELGATQQKVADIADYRFVYHVLAADPQPRIRVCNLLQFKATVATFEWKAYFYLM